MMYINPKVENIFMPFAGEIIWKPCGPSNTPARIKPTIPYEYSGRNLLSERHPASVSTVRA